MPISDELHSTDVQEILDDLRINWNKKPDSEGWINIKSPLRDDKHPSFGLNIHTGAWKDHGTDKSGDLVDLIVKLEGKDKREAINWIKERANLDGLVYEKSAQNGTTKKPKKRPGKEGFWSNKRIKRLKGAQARLKENKDHPLVKTAYHYDRISHKTLVYFGCGILEQWNKEWLVFPYETGVQLYRREDGSKDVRGLKGSSPGNSFFGSRKVTGDREKLFIAKSPRETMLFYQFYRNEADVIGLCTGERSSLSKEQIKWLRSQHEAVGCFP